jgi:hypothetical protein
MCYTCDMAWDIVMMVWWFGLWVAMLFEPYVLGGVQQGGTSWYVLCVACCGRCSSFQQSYLALCTRGPSCLRSVRRHGPEV